MVDGKEELRDEVIQLSQLEADLAERIEGLENEVLRLNATVDWFIHVVIPAVHRCPASLPVDPNTGLSMWNAYVVELNKRRNLPRGGDRLGYDQDMREQEAV